MLLYIDKKKEKRRKITIVLVIVFSITLVLFNIKQFNTFLHHNLESLTTYQPLQHTNLWYKKTSPVHLFSINQPYTAKILLIPTKLNRENATTIAIALSKLPQKKYTLNFTSEIATTEKEKLTELTTYLHSISNKSTNKHPLIITTQLDSIKDIINSNKLYPSTFNYKQSADATFSPILDKLFPLKRQPQTTLEIEKETLERFASDNLKEIKALILDDKEIDFTLKNIFLKNIRLCLIAKDEISCSLSQKNSFLKNLATAQQKLSSKVPQKLILWTSNEQIDISPLPQLQSDEGLYFTGLNRKTYLLPQNIQPLTDTKEYLYILKQQAGLNPAYTTPDMKLYKFKTTEVILDDEI